MTAAAARASALLGCAWGCGLTCGARGFLVACIASWRCACLHVIQRVPMHSSLKLLPLHPGWAWCSPPGCRTGTAWTMQQPLQRWVFSCSQAHQLAHQLAAHSAFPAEACAMPCHASKRLRQATGGAAKHPCMHLTPPPPPIHLHAQRRWRQQRRHSMSHAHRRRNRGLRSLFRARAGSDSAGITQVPAGSCVHCTTDLCVTI